MSVRAKFKLTSIRQSCYGVPHARTLRFEAQYDGSVPEDVCFSNTTPTGHFEMECNNQAALDQFELGKNYYFDITPAND